MAEHLDRSANDVMEAGSKIFREIGKQLESLQDAISLNPTHGEVTDALGEEAALVQREAYRRGHQSGWFKGALAFGCVLLAGLAVLSLAVSGESKQGTDENSFPSLAGRS